MTASVCFEVKTAINQHAVRQKLSDKWKGEGYNVSIFQYPEYGDELFCYLAFFFGTPNEESMIREVVTYLLDITLEHQIYYYRYSEFNPFEVDFPVLEITIDDIFSEAFRPTIEKDNEVRYLISMRSFG